MPELRKITRTITEFQAQWIDDQSEETGMPASEILRRLIEIGIKAEEEREHRALFTGDQLREAREIASEKGVSLKSWLRGLVNRERDRFFGRF